MPAPRTGAKSKPKGRFLSRSRRRPAWVNSNRAGPSAGLALKGTGPVSGPDLSGLRAFHHGVHVHGTEVSTSNLWNVLGLQPRPGDSVPPDTGAAWGWPTRLSAFLSCQHSPLQARLLDPTARRDTFRPGSCSECEALGRLCCGHHPIQTLSKQGPGAGPWTEEAEG